MFKNSQALDSNQHAQLRFKPANDFGFSSDLATAPLAPFEVDNAAACFPVLFAPDGPVTAMAVLGLAGRNVFLDADQKWTAAYIPAHVRRYPFILARVADREGFLLAADMDAPQFGSADGELVFKDGKINSLFDNAVKLLEQYETNLEVGRQSLAELETTGVLVARDLNIDDGHTKRLIGGFRMVDEAKLMALDDATLARWVRNGVMQIVQSHWESLRHLNAVVEASSRPAQLQ